MSNYKEDLIRKLLGKQGRAATTNTDNQVNIAISPSFADKISSYSASQSPRLVQLPPLGEHPDTFLSITCKILCVASDKLLLHSSEVSRIEGISSGDIMVVILGPVQYCYLPYVIRAHLGGAAVIYT